MSETTLYVIPLNAPTPKELSHLPTSTGSFAARVHFSEENGGVLALSAPELEAMAKSPEVFTLRNLVVIMGIQGAFYDPLFSASAARLGARVVEWAELEAAMRQDNTEKQRQADKTPWSKPKPTEHATGDDLPGAEVDE